MFPLLVVTTATAQVLPYVPIAFQNYDIIEYWNNNRSVLGIDSYSQNITSKDQNGIDRIYQLQFSSKNNIDEFNRNQTHYLPQYGGF